MAQGPAGTGRLDYGCVVPVKAMATVAPAQSLSRVAAAVSVPTFTSTSPSVGIEDAVAPTVAGLEAKVSADVSQAGLSVVIDFAVRDVRVTRAPALLAMSAWTSPGWPGTV